MALLTAVAVLTMWTLVRRSLAAREIALLDEVPAAVRLGRPATDPVVVAFFEALDRVGADFEQQGDAFQYRQLIDLIACGPRLASARAAAILLEGKQLNRFARDQELRNELAEMTAHNARRAATRAEREGYVKLLERLVGLAGGSGPTAASLEVWLAPALADLADTAAPMTRQLNSAYLIARTGGDAQLAALADVLARGSGTPIARETAAARGELNMVTLRELGPVDHALPSFADAYENASEPAYEGAAAGEYDDG